MTKPGDPQKGIAAREEQAEQDAKDAAATAGQQEAEVKAEASEEAAKPKPKRAAKKKPQASEAEGTAAEETGVDKAGAAAEGGGERSETGAAVTEPEAEAAAVTEPEAEAAAEPAEKPKPKRTRKKAEPAAEAPKPAPQRRERRPAGERVIVRAQARYVRSSARKARLVCDHIRGKSVAEARAILAFSPRAVSEAWTKLLESAVANAENNHDLVGEDLKVHAVYADEGPTIKRYQPRAMGRATRIRKRTSHLSIQLTPKD